MEHGPGGFGGVLFFLPSPQAFLSWSGGPFGHPRVASSGRWGGIATSLVSGHRALYVMFIVIKSVEGM